MMIAFVKDVVEVIVLHMRTAEGERETQSRSKLQGALEMLDSALDELAEESTTSVKDAK